MVRVYCTVSKRRDGACNYKSKTEKRATQFDFFFRTFDESTFIQGVCMNIDLNEISQ